MLYFVSIACGAYFAVSRVLAALRASLVDRFVVGVLLGSWILAIVWALSVTL
jgi:hypothetical protein